MHVTPKFLYGQLEKFTDTEDTRGEGLEDIEIFQRVLSATEILNAVSLRITTTTTMERMLSPDM